MKSDYDGGESGRILVSETGVPVFPVSRNVSMIWCSQFNNIFCLN